MNLENILKNVGMTYEEAVSIGLIIPGSKGWGHLSPSLQLLLKEKNSQLAKLAKKEIQDKHSKYGNPAKKAALDLYGEYLNQNFGKGKRKTSLNILCLPGIHFIERSAYKPLENRINNIIGVERDEQVFGILEKCQQRRTLPDNMELYNMDVAKFIDDTSLTFHTAFLDFTGYFQREYYNTISNLFKQNKLEDQGILGLTILCGREGDAAKQTFTDCVIYPYFYLNQIFNKGGSYCSQEHYTKIRNEILSKFEDPNFFRKYRVRALPIMMGMWGLTNGEPNFSLERKRVYVPEDGKVIMYLEGKRGNPLELVLVRYTKKDLDPDRLYDIAKDWVVNHEKKLDYRRIQIENGEVTVGHLAC